MASKLLHKIRHSLFKEETPQTDLSAAAEDCPEISELDDDTEGLSSRLSGTLSFEGEQNIKHEDEGGSSEAESDLDLEESLENDSEGTGFPAGQQPQPLLTVQLQEKWRRSRTRSIPEKVMFEVTNATVVQDHSSKFVLYTIHVIKSGQFDKCPGIITRRYTDFAKLHSHLRKHNKEDMEGIVFPRKKLRRNFAAETIGKRSRAFEQYLAHLYSIADLRRSPVFLDFFFFRDLVEGQSLLRAGQYEEALRCFVNAMNLQEKLGSWQQGNWLFTLASIVASFQELEQLEEAQEYCERALRDLSTHQEEKHPLLVPLLQANVRLSWKISKDKRHSEAHLQKLRDSGVDVGNQPSLKEYLIKESLESKK
ncbi:sorting nexin-21 isoform X1 [Erpetoichthys calabaricus]|uniref:Sorting nexin family member 21 n=1 Tax=Erpetoichthys calabaricus TaxID=27687 RepID=A0A8C4S7M2_ERPCA|nr:sorting nexin-21 isoform X1 [Erpetoichthys calabaricus]XP_028667670.1 sorting nexin-21 isoform X1 [Erpetoichthys calabaricus]XP_028667671.1 sorting nexin-21 isoform X1 [Erpetoichthys calabaricus]XP_028667674.1 sorting nexin-21 isoform X1 [Erpetoichthys calabaricus]